MLFSQTDILLLFYTSLNLKIIFQLKSEGHYSILKEINRLSWASVKTENKYDSQHKTVFHSIILMYFPFW